jgi:hypothetical protein
MSDFTQYIGLTLKELEPILKKDGKIFRVVSVDGIPCIVTRDYRTDRLNVILKNNVISSVSGWG